MRPTNKPLRPAGFRELRISNKLQRRSTLAQLFPDRALAVEIPDANANAEHAKKKSARVFHAMGIVEHKSVVADDADAGDDVIPPLPLVPIAARAFIKFLLQLLAYG